MKVNFDHFQNNFTSYKVLQIGKLAAIAYKQPASKMIKTIFIEFKLKGSKQMEPEQSPLCIQLLDHAIRGPGYRTTLSKSFSSEIYSLF
jgi:hypothetical protein